jgi:isocitrate dehydrogenase
MGLSKPSIVVIPGDGIGPDVVTATLTILKAANANLDWVICEAGEGLFKRGVSTGVPASTLAEIHRHGLVLKGPLTTPVGYGERSANVFLRKTFGLYANIRPVKQYPNIPSLFSDIPIDLVVIRENTEDLYAGIEYDHQPGVAQSIKLISQLGCDTINAFAFEYAKKTRRASLHCATKANILKHTEGMMKTSFEAMAKSYPSVQAHHMIIDNCAHQLVVNPSQFDMIVTTNMNGDIISDLTSGLVGGLGIAPSANIGRDVAMFEAVHGAAPDIAGKNKANPTAMILSAVMMLRYMDQSAVADTIEQALAVTFEQAIFTSDLDATGGVSTTEFTDAVIRNLGQSLATFTPSSFAPIKMPEIHAKPVQTGMCYGVDVIIMSDAPYDQLQASLNTTAKNNECQSVELYNRGHLITASPTPPLIPQWYCRFKYETKDESAALSGLIADVEANYDWVSVEKLMRFNEV